MKPRDRICATLYHEEPDKIPDGADMASVPGPIKQTTIKEVLGFRVWRSNFGSVHIDISQELTLPRKTEYASSMSWWYTVAPAIRWPEDLDHQEQPRLDMDAVKSAKRRTEELHREGYFVVVGHHGVFDVPRRYLRDMRQWLIDVVKDPAFAKRLVEFGMKPILEIDTAMIEEAGVDAVHITGDMGTPEGPFISPRHYRELIYPWHHRMAESFHKRGAFFFIHSHGYLMPIMDDMVNAGFDAINPVSPLDRMSLAEMKGKYGDKVTLWADLTWKMGGKAKIDTEKYGRIILGEEPLEEVLPLLRYTVETAAPGGGFIFSLPKPLDHAKEVWEKLRRYPVLGRDVRKR